jgi:uncharacterized protein (TIGR02246 family)
MRIRALSAFAVIAALSACQPGRDLDGTRGTAIRGAVVTAIDDLYAAMNEHDADRVLGHYLESDDFLYVGVSDVMQGWERFSAMTAPWYAMHPDVTFEHEILHMQILAPDVATVTTRGSSTESPHLMTTRTLVLRDGRWLIALEHESWPGAETPQPQHPMSQ